MKQTSISEAISKSTSRAAAAILVASSFILSCSDANTSNVVPSSSNSTGTPLRSASGILTNGYTNDDGTPSGRMSSTGTSGGYYWSLYQDGGSASITQGSGGNFAISYSNVNDAVGGKGWNPGSARNIGYNVGALSGSYNLVGIYGWTTSPLIEYYVCELGSNIGGSKVNTVSSDGHTYTFYKHQQVNQPSIQGTATFWQYLDNWGGSSTGSNHTVSMTNHINNWKSKGGQGFGNYDYQILAVEAWSGKSGYINATVW